VKHDEFEALMAKVRALPPMTDEERDEQARNFAAGNVALSTGQSFEEVRALVDKACNERDRARGGRYSGLVRRFLTAWDRGTAAQLTEAIAALRAHEGLPPVPSAFGEGR
jgi:hypothetical protein